MNSTSFHTTEDKILSRQHINQIHHIKAMQEKRRNKIFQFITQYMFRHSLFGFCHCWICYMHVLVRRLSFVCINSHTRKLNRFPPETKYVKSNKKKPHKAKSNAIFQMCYYLRTFTPHILACLWVWCVHNVKECQKCLYMCIFSQMCQDVCCVMTKKGQNETTGIVPEINKHDVVEERNDELIWKNKIIMPRPSILQLASMALSNTTQLCRTKYATTVACSENDLFFDFFSHCFSAHSKLER